MRASGLTLLNAFPRRSHIPSQRLPRQHQRCKRIDPIELPPPLMPLPTTTFGMTGIPDLALATKIWTP